MSVCDAESVWQDFTIYREQPTVDTLSAGELQIATYDSGDITGARFDDTVKYENFEGTCVEPTPSVPGELSFYITINSRPYYFEGTTRKEADTLDTYLATGTYTALDLDARREAGEDDAPDAIDPGDSGTWGGSHGG